MALTEKRELFCQEYTISFSAKDSAIKAGYSENRAKQTGYDLMNDKEVQARIKELLSVTHEKSGITREKQLERLDKAFDLAELNEKPSDMVKAIEAQNKMLGLNEPEKVAQTSETTIKIVHVEGGI